MLVFFSRHALNDAPGPRSNDEAGMCAEGSAPYAIITTKVIITLLFVCLVSVRTLSGSKRCRKTNEATSSLKQGLCCEANKKLTRM
jgi:hypothetical protein